jgi:ribosomal protein L16 Arg81 hydroxylase
MNNSTKKQPKFNLDWLIEPIDRDVFFNNYWEQKPLWIERKRNRNFFDKLINIKNVDHIITTTQHQPFTIVLNQQILPRTYYQQGEDKEKVLEFFNNGATILMDKIEKSWKPLKSLCNEVEKDLQVCKSIFCNLFFTPPDSQAFEIHADNQDVFILQIEGSKNWSVYESEYALPITDEQTVLSKKFEKDHDPILDINLRKGDVLYIPKGFPHKVKTNKELSIHITFTLINYTLFDFYEILLKAISNDNKVFRKSLNRSFFDNEILEGKINDFISPALIEKTKNILLSEILNKQKPIYEKVFLDIGRVDKINKETTLEVRENLNVVFQKVNGNIEVITNGGEFSLDTKSGSRALEFIFDRKIFKIFEIPGQLSDNEKIDLVRSLVETGMVSIAKINIILVFFSLF